MLSCRVFLCHCIDPQDLQEANVMSQLQEKLDEEGARIVLYPGSANEEGFLPFLNKELATCRWFIYVQNPQAVTSVQMHVAVGNALRLMRQKELLGVQRLLLKRGDTDQVPTEWSEFPTFDATRDPARALERLILSLTPPDATLSTPVPVASLSGQVPAASLPPSPTYDRPSSASSSRSILKRDSTQRTSRANAPTTSPLFVPPPPPQRSWPQLRPERNSRRVLLTGLGIVGLAGVGSLTIARLRNSQAKAVASPSGARPASPTTVPGTTLSIYHDHTDVVKDLAWSPDGINVASASADKTVRIWDRRNGTDVLTYSEHQAPVNAVAWAPASWIAPYTFIATGGDDNTVRIWSVPDGTTHFTYKSHKAPVKSLAWSPSGLFLASTSFDTTVQIWNTFEGRLITTYTGHKSVVNAAAWSADGTVMASASSDGTVQVWSPWDSTLYQTYTGHSASVNALVWAPNQGAIASASSDKTVQVWQANDCRLIFVCTDHTDAINTLARSPDGQFLVSGSTDKTVRIWDAWGHGKQALVYQSNSAPIYTVGWSPNGQYIASGGKDHTVHIWESV